MPRPARIHGEHRVVPLPDGAWEEAMTLTRESQATAALRNAMQRNASLRSAPQRPDNVGPPPRVGPTGPQPQPEHALLGRIKPMN